MSDKEISQLGKDLEAIRKEILEEEMTNNNNPNDAPGLGGGGAELDLGPIKALLQEYYDKYAWAGAKTEQLLEGIVALVAEVERLRANQSKVLSYLETFHGTDRELIENVTEVLDGK